MLRGDDAVCPPGRVRALIRTVLAGALFLGLVAACLQLRSGSRVALEASQDDVKAPAGGAAPADGSAAAVAAAKARVKALHKNLEHIEQSFTKQVSFAVCQAPPANPCTRTACGTQGARSVSLSRRQRGCSPKQRWLCATC